MKFRRRATLPRPELATLLADLSQRIKGQPEVLTRLAEAIIRRETEAVPPRGSRGNFFFPGPTGTGKTFTAQTVADLLFGPGRLLIFDCSELKTVEGVTAVLGNRTGDAGRFAAAYSKVPVGGWLFDEIEKAHPEFVDLFLQMAGDGRVTSASGQTIDLSRIYLFVTSNLGSAQILGREHLPFSTLERHVIHHVQRHLRPELLGRFGRPYVFRPLTRDAQREIAASKLDHLIEWHKVKGRKISYEPGVVDFVLQRGFSSRFGARPLLDAIEEHVGNPVAHSLLSGGTGDGRLVVRYGRLDLVP